MTNTLLKDFSVRAPTMGDIERVADLIDTCEIAERGEPGFALEDLRVDWGKPDFNLETDAWVVLTPEKRIVGYAVMFNRENVRLYVITHVHPEYRNRGIGTYLARLGETRARQQVPEAPPGVRVSVFNPVSSGNDAGRALLEREGYSLSRHFWHMQIDMDKAPPIARWPNGIGVRTFIPGQDDRATFEVIEETFEDHWGHVPMRFETWRQMMIEREDFDPSVDSQNTTGATRLYQRAGMRVARQYDTYHRRSSTQGGTRSYRRLSQQHPQVPFRDRDAA